MLSSRPKFSIVWIPQIDAFLCHELEEGQKKMLYVEIFGVSCRFFVDIFKVFVNCQEHFFLICGKFLCIIIIMCPCCSLTFNFKGRKWEGGGELMDIGEMKNYN